MSKFHKSLLATGLLLMAGWVAAQGATSALNKYPGVGRDATPKEVAAWDTDVRPDFKGLPAGAGSVAKGQDVWESKCAQCHGVFGESNEVFSPLIGGTSAADIKTGRASKLTDPTGGRTTLMKLATVSTLWDYINRAMPWTAPKSLSTEEVYAVTAFMLNLGGVVPDDFTLSDKNISQVQAKMPNRNGMSTAHALWPGKEFGGVAKPDTRNTACMSNCQAEPKLASLLPDFARNAHGNLSEQNRLVGPQRGAETAQPERKDAALGAARVAQATPAVKPPATQANANNQAAIALLGKNTCTACHGMSNRIVGPSFTEIAKKHAGQEDYLAGKIKAGSTGVWGPIPMPPQSLSEAEAKTIAAWLALGAGK